MNNHEAFERTMRTSIFLCFSIVLHGCVFLIIMFSMTSTQKISQKNNTKNLDPISLLTNQATETKQFEHLVPSRPKNKIATIKSSLKNKTSHTTSLTPPSVTSNKHDENNAPQISNMIRIKYQQQIHQKIAQARQPLPYFVQRQDMQGTAVVQLSISPLGTFANTPTIKTSSGYNALDQEALQMVSRAVPFPPIPSSITQTNLQITVPIRFKPDQ